ncbi:MAG: hypothetical protein ACR2LF_05375 [Jatrophihabitantaceae bacterium]
MRDLVLPAFELDCRDWLVVTPEQSGLPDEIGGAPLLAVLSTVVLDEDSFRPVSGVLTVGLLDGPAGELPSCRPLGPGSVAREITCAGDCVERCGDALRYLLPAPDEQLALLAEFSLAEDAGADLVGRVESLMTSFRWAA